MHDEKWKYPVDPTDCGDQSRLLVGSTGYFPFLVMGVMLNSRNEGLENVSYEKQNYPVDPTGGGGGGRCPSGGRGRGLHAAAELLIEHVRSVDDRRRLVDRRAGRRVLLVLVLLLLLLLLLLVLLPLVLLVLLVRQLWRQVWNSLGEL